jgi:SAM-dependent methyltransferase
MSAHAFDEAYFVGGTKSNYQDYREVEPAIDSGFMPVVRQYAERCGAGRERRAYLDVGCAMGFYVERFAALGWDAAGIDISEYAIREGERRGVQGLTVGSAEELPYPDGTFDYVTVIDVIEHVEPAGVTAMVKEVHRVLTAGGVCFAATPNFLSNQYWNVHTPGFVDKDETHINYQSVESMRTLFSDFSECLIYGHTPFVDQFHAFDVSGAFADGLLRVGIVNRLARHAAWKLLGRSTEYSSYLHAVARK